MIDRIARDRLALGLRRLASGQLSIGEFDDLENLILSEDRAVTEMWILGWLQYSDTGSGKVRLRGDRRLCRERRRVIARAVLFLRSDQEYVHGRALQNQTILAIDGWLFLGAVGAAIGAIFAFGYPAIISVFALYALWMLWHLISQVIAGWFPRVRREPAPTEPGGAVWPFASDETLRAALVQPVFLVGRA